MAVYHTNSSVGNGIDFTVTGPDVYNTVIGGAGNDTLQSNPNLVTLNGYLSYSYDSLQAGSGNDLLVVNGNNDILTGGSGHDTFNVAAADGNVGSSFITNYNPSKDIIELGVGVGIASITRFVASSTQTPGPDVTIVSLSNGGVVSLTGLDPTRLTSADFDGAAIPTGCVLFGAVYSSNQILTVSKGNNTINGSLFGGDTIHGGSGNDSIVAGNGVPASPSIPGGYAAHGSLIYAGTGADTILGSSANDTIYGSSGTASTSPNLVVNGSFEIGSVPEPRWYVTKDVYGWHTDIGVGIEIESGHIAGMAPSDGNYKVELDSNNNSNMWQEIHTGGTGKFLLSFDYSPRPGVSAASNIVEVYWRGALLDTLTGTTGGWVTHNYAVSGAGANSKLEFRAAGTSDAVGGFLDNVKVVADTPSNSLITGGLGADMLHGGSGANHFIYTSIADSTITAHDTIVNFTQGDDVIDLSALKSSGIVNFSSLHIASTASQTIITSGQFEVNLQGVIHLHANDFIFGS